MAGGSTGAERPEVEAVGVSPLDPGALAPVVAEAPLPSVPLLPPASPGPRTPRASRWRSPSLWLALATTIVLAPFLFGGYSIAQSPLGTKGKETLHGLPVVPVADPAASMLLDEPVLVYLKRCLLEGRFPLLLMDSGLGAFSVESPLVGSFYLLNPLLLLLPTSRPLYYDLFMILHVYVLVFGLRSLARRYAGPFPAVLAAVLVGLGGVTTAWLNMTHYRNFVWLPWMATAAIGLGRNERPRRNTLLLFAATVAAGTAGNVQEFGTAVASTVLLYAAELVARRPAPLRARWLVPLTVLAGLLVSAVAIVPYAVAHRDGVMFATNDVGRSLRQSSPTWVFSWILPKVIGYYPALFARNRPYWPISDLSTFGFLALLLGVAVGLLHLRRWRDSPRTVVCAVIPLVLVAGVTKIVHPHALDFVQHVPLLREFFFIKYHMYLFALATVPMAIGLDRALHAPRAERRALLGLASAALVAALAVVALWLAADPDYTIHPGAGPALEFHVLVVTFGTSLAVAVLGFALLFVRPRSLKPCLLVLVVAQALVLVPAGFAKRQGYYWSPSRAIVDRHPELKGRRLLVKDAANGNLFYGTESIGMMDATVNAAHREFLNRFFTLANPAAIYQPVTPALSPTEVLALRFLGVSHVVGYGLADEGVGRRIAKNLYELPDPVPRVFRLSRAAYLKLGDRPPTPETIAAVVGDLALEMSAAVQPAILGRSGERFQIEVPAGSGDGWLVLNQAYSRSWRLDGREGTRFLGIWPAWEVGDGVAVARHRIDYWPRGLTLAMWLTLAGSALFALVYWRAPREA